MREESNAYDFSIPCTLSKMDFFVQRDKNSKERRTGCTSSPALSAAGHPDHWSNNLADALTSEISNMYTPAHPHACRELDRYSKKKRVGERKINCSLASLVPKSTCDSDRSP